MLAHPNDKMKRQSTPISSTMQHPNCVQKPSSNYRPDKYLESKVGISICTVQRGREGKEPEFLRCRWITYSCDQNFTLQEISICPNSQHGSKWEEQQQHHPTKKKKKTYSALLLIESPLLRAKTKIGFTSKALLRTTQQGQMEETSLRREGAHFRGWRMPHQ